MDDRRVGRVIREVRVRRAWRQVDLTTAAGVGRSTIPEVERGRLDRLTLRTLRRIVGPLDVRLDVDAWWRSGDADRLLDAGHAVLVEHVVRSFDGAGWVTRVEVSVNHFGERGSTDIVAWHAIERILVLVEVKTRIGDVQELTATFGRKVRIVPPALQHEAGWNAVKVARLLVVPDDRRSRAVVREHAGTLAALWPQRTVAVRRGILEPRAMPDGAIWFVPTGSHATGRARLRASSTSRVRTRPRRRPLA